MHRFAGFVFCFFLLVSYSLAQETQDDSLPPPSHLPAKFGGGVGFAPFLLSMDFNPINDYLRKSNAGQFSTGPMFMTGGQAYGYILFVRNLRGGVMWGSGSVNSLAASGGMTRDVELHVGFTGATVEYVVPVSARLDLALGTMLGAGGMDITMKRDDGTPKQWDSVWTQFGSAQPAANFSRKMTGSFFMYEPMAHVEYAMLRWLGLRVGVGYLGTLGGSWKLDDKYDMIGVPDKINSRGLSINAGVFLGTFIF